MRIATWNVNSLRTRLHQVLRWWDEHPDLSVLCLQETKVPDPDFPIAPFAERGLAIAYSGQKSYNGVALIARFPLTQIQIGLGQDPWDDQKRAIAAVCEGIRIVNVYVPNGGDLDSDKYPYKLGWLQALQGFLQHQRTQPEPCLVCGDFNIAPEPRDLHNPDYGGIGASPAERLALQQLQALGFGDAFRQRTAAAGHYSWWDYRQAAFRRNHGWRIDHIYLDDTLSDRLLACEMDGAPRHWPQPSDHIPVWAELQDGENGAERS
ncbi:MAG: exodeoxyribonuclease III [Oscillatoriales cyanobacterium SM2_1_8]|nr:exodeoxyribonuclease III [Oscillatoriales cyanobacterium SM2_1_8]